jgi:hypothetical protein
MSDTGNWIVVKIETAPGGERTERYVRPFPTSVAAHEFKAAQPPFIPHIIIRLMSPPTDPAGDDPSWLSWEKAAH